MRLYGKNFAVFHGDLAENNFIFLYNVYIFKYGHILLSFLKFAVKHSTSPLSVISTMP